MKLAVTQRSWSRNEGDQVLPDADVLAHFDVLRGDDPVHRRDDFGVAQVELRLVQLGTRLLHLRCRLVGFRLLHRYLLGRGTGIALCSLRCNRLLLRDCDLFLRSNGIGLGGDHRSLIRLGSSYSLVILLLGDHVLFHQGRVALEIELRLGVVGFGLRNFRLRLVELSKSALYLCAGCQHIRICRRERAVGLQIRLTGTFTPAAS